MAPLTPHWEQPSHPAIQKVLFSNEEEFTTKSISLINVPPFGVYTKLSFPPCTPATKPTYATVQTGKEEHLNLNSDLVYINHSCEPSVIFDTTSKLILASSTGLKAGQELTFFYPSTEWDMAQGFDCFCGSATCRGYISGAKNMPIESLEGMWLNKHIREMLEERDGEVKVEAAAGLENGNHTKHEKATQNGTKTEASGPGIPTSAPLEDPTLAALQENLARARKTVDAAQKALNTYQNVHYGNDIGFLYGQKGAVRENGVGSRELSGEMGGDTSV